MSSQFQVGQTPLPVGTSIVPGSLRAEMEARRAARARFEVKETISIVVPLCMQLGELHTRGRTLFVHPSCIRYGRDGSVAILEDRAHTMPGLPRDRACVAPEERRGPEGDARSSVFAVGAILYELLTGAAIGPGMRRPSEVLPDLPASLEAILGKALVADPKHRPADLAALAAALHLIAPGASTAPPAADVSHLDHDEDFEVDIRLSMIPPSEVGPAVILPDPPALPPAVAARPALPRLQSIQSEGPYTVAIPQPDPGRRSSIDPTQRLSDLKSCLEADPRPRYVVIKDGMDHGPFSAVELLQQIASGLFVGENVLRDSFSGEERFIKDWEEFAPFAEQAKLNRDIKHEKRALEAVVVAEKKGTQYKALLGAAVLGVLAAGGAGIWYRERANKERELEVQAERSTAIDVDGGLGSGKAAAHAGGVAGGPRPAGAGNFPVVAGGGSCEAAQAKYSEEYKIGGDNGPPDLTAGAYGAVLNRGSYLNSCGVPSSMAVNICVAVQNGRAVGVTVSTTPSNPGIASCVAAQVRSLPFPSNPRLDVTRTTFSAN